MSLVTGLITSFMLDSDNGLYINFTDPISLLIDFLHQFHPTKCCFSHANIKTLPFPPPTYQPPPSQPFNTKPTNLRHLLLIKQMEK